MKPRAPKAVGKYWRISQVLLVVALLVSLYLAFQSLRDGGVAGCGPGSNCGVVLSSPWAYVLKLPVSIFAAALYCAMLAAIRAAIHGHPPARKILSAGGLVIVGAAIWFISLQLLVLRAFCWLCFTAHISGTAAALVILIKAAPPNGPALGWAGSMLATMIMLQIAFSPKTFTEARLRPSTGTQNLAVSSPAPPSGSAEQTVPTKPQFITFLNGHFQLEAGFFPITGPEGSDQLILKLFDYTCSHCRKTHLMLEQAREEFPDLRIVSAPVPLETKCNRLMKVTPQSHVDACDYARIGLAIWNGAPNLFKVFDAWMWETEKPRPLAEVRAYAAELMGQAELEKASAAELVNRQIQQAVNIYEVNSRQAGRANLPQLIFAESSIVGTPPHLSELKSVLANHLPKKGTQTPR